MLLVSHFLLLPGTRGGDGEITKSRAHTINPHFGEQEFKMPALLITRNPVVGSYDPERQFGAWCTSESVIQGSLPRPGRRATAECKVFNFFCPPPTIFGPPMDAGTSKRLIFKLSSTFYPSCEAGEAFARFQELVLLKTILAALAKPLASLTCKLGTNTVQIHTRRTKATCDNLSDWVEAERLVFA